MPYVALSDLSGKIPPSFITQALDDDQDGAADAGLWDLIAAQAAQEIEGILGQRYTVPFAEPYPALVRQAALVFAAEALYARRGIAESANPWHSQAEAMRKRLGAIAAGEQPLQPETDRARPSGTAITEPAKTFSPTGRMAI